MRNLVHLGLSLLLLTASTFAQDQVLPKPEHTIWVHITSTPTEVDIYSIPAVAEEVSSEPFTNQAYAATPVATDAKTEAQASEPVFLGRTPCIVVVDLTWEPGFTKRKWEDIHVWSAGGACHPAYNLEDKSYDLYLAFRAQKEGLLPVDVERKIGHLAYPGYWWSETGSWTTEMKMEIAMEPDPDALRRNVEQKPRKVIIAENTGDNETPLGTLLIEANVPGAVVYVDGEEAGNVPLDVVLHGGVHEIAVYKEGYRTYKKRVNVPGRAKSRMEAILVPGAE